MLNKIFDLLKKRITLGFVVSTLITLIIAITLKYLCELYLGVTIIKGSIDSLDMSYYAIITCVKLLVSTLTEYFLESKYTMPLGDVPKDFMYIDNTILKMDNSSSLTGNKDKTVYSTKGKQPLTQNNPSDNSTTPTPSKMLSVDETLKLREEFKDNLNKQRDMIKRLGNLKRLNNLNYYLDSKGGLELSAPSDVADNKLEKIAAEVGIIDRIINTKFAEYNKLEGKDFVSNDGSLGKSYSNLKAFVKKEYDELFDKE